MKTWLSLCVLVLIGLVYAFRCAYLSDKKREQLLYAFCLEAGCTELQCKVFSTTLKSNMHCPKLSISRSE